MAEKRSTITIDPRNELDILLVAAVKQHGVENMAADLKISASWLYRVIKGLGSLPGHKFQEMIEILRVDTYQHSLTVKPSKGLE